MLLSLPVALAVSWTTNAVDLDANPPAPSVPAETRAAEPLARRRERRLAAANKAVGVTLEIGAGLAYALTGAVVISANAKATNEGCGTPEKACRGGLPVGVVAHLGATAMGWLGTIPLAAARDASVWRSPLFWAGTALDLASYFAFWDVPRRFDGRDARVTASGLLLGGCIVGTVLQIWGAEVAPPRHPGRYAGRSPQLAPACAPSREGVVCGLAMAGF